MPSKQAADFDRRLQPSISRDREGDKAPAARQTFATGLSLSMEQDLIKHDVIDELESERSRPGSEGLSQIQYDDQKSYAFEALNAEMENELPLNQPVGRSEPDEIKLDNFNFEDSQNLRQQEDDDDGEDSGYMR